MTAVAGKSTAAVTTRPLARAEWQVTGASGKSSRLSRSHPARQIPAQVAETKISTENALQVKIDGFQANKAPKVGTLGGLIQSDDETAHFLNLAPASARAAPWLSRPPHEAARHPPTDIQGRMGQIAPGERQNLEPETAGQDLAPGRMEFLRQVMELRAIRRRGAGGFRPPRKGSLARP
ncbi:hypothetical protein [Stagnihabitans tardus]|uniref:Uncharacterized protein n=1 Tax=Stagnihabitans tardus TaxID=2699202 RepID=A0AAE4YBM2_9RHOB|nr:hypothetical protein [Stagnihabitans tardus]NBZ88697.1 hypothetical protein [Stagnihabitans tardus]